MDCVKPNVVKTDEGYIQVPCGSCILCRIARTREWCTRLQLENSTWNESVFITLTYEDAFVHFTNCGSPTLFKKDLENFFKRIRSQFHHDAVVKAHQLYPYLLAKDEEFKEHVKELCRRFRYFACGEYGDRTHRPHYHAIVFGISPSELSLLQNKWPFGFVSVGGVSPQSIQYVTGYVRKKRMKKSKDPKDFGCLHQAPEFQIQSQGLGLSYYEAHKDLYRSTLSLRINGHRESIPRYFLKKDDVARNSLRAVNRVENPQESNLKRARDVLRARDPSKCILDEMRRSVIQKANTEHAKNALYQKGTI